MRPADAGLVGALLYPVQFDADPRDGIPRVLDRVVRSGALGVGPEAFLAAIRSALAGDEPLSRIIPQDHPEEVVRQYLAEVALRLEGDPGPSE